MRLDIRLIGKQHFKSFQRNRASPGARPAIEIVHTDQGLSLIHIFHKMKADITTEVSPIVGSEKQSEELVSYLLREFE